MAEKVICSRLQLAWSERKRRARESVREGENNNAEDPKSPGCQVDDLLSVRWQQLRCIIVGFQIDHFVRSADNAFGFAGDANGSGFLGDRLPSG